MKMEHYFENKTHKAINILRNKDLAAEESVRNKFKSMGRTVHKFEENVAHQLGLSANRTKIKLYKSELHFQEVLQSKLRSWSRKISRIENKAIDDLKNATSVVRKNAINVAKEVERTESKIARKTKKSFIALGIGLKHMFRRTKRIIKKPFKEKPKPVKVRPIKDIRHHEHKPQAELEVFKKLRTDLDRKDMLDDEETIINKRINNMERTRSALNIMLKRLGARKLLKQKAIKVKKQRIIALDEEILKLKKVKNQVVNKENNLDKDISKLNTISDDNNLNKGVFFRFFKKKKAKKKAIIDELKNLYDNT